MDDLIQVPGQSECAGQGSPGDFSASNQANEQTFAAWLQTGALLIIFGLTAGMILGSVPHLGVPAVAFALLAVVSGGALITISGISFLRRRDDLAQGRFDASGSVVTAATILVILVGLAALLVVVLLRPL